MKLEFIFMISLLAVCLAGCGNGNRIFFSGGSNNWKAIAVICITL